jgi:hypothetical protein
MPENFGKKMAGKKWSELFGTAEVVGEKRMVVYGDERRGSNGLAMPFSTKINMLVSALG